MLKIGITGGIGSGKSTVCRLFELLGVPVYYADSESKKILDTDNVRHEVLKVFGSKITASGGAIDRKKLAEIVFNNKTELEKLNAILHPAVGLHFEEWVKKQTATYVLKEAAILIESGASKQVDKIILVVAPLELKIQRTVNRDGAALEEVMNRIQNQMPDDEKKKYSDYVIENDEQHLLIPQVLKLHELFSGK